MPNSPSARTGRSKSATKLPDTLDTEQRQTIEWLRQEFARDIPPSLAAWHKLGLLAQELAPKSSPQEGPQRVETYGKRQVQLLAKRIGCRPTRVYQARMFVEVYPDFDADVAPLEGLSWLHIGALLAVKDEKQRRKFQKECLKRKWSSGQLQLEIRARVGRQRRSGTGRTTAVPSDDRTGSADPARSTAGQIAALVRLVAGPRVAGSSCQLPGISKSCRSSSLRLGRDVARTS